MAEIKTFRVSRDEHGNPVLATGSGIRLADGTIAGISSESVPPTLPSARLPSMRTGSIGLTGMVVATVGVIQDGVLRGTPVRVDLSGQTIVRCPVPSTPPSEPQEPVRTTWDRLFSAEEELGD